MNPLKIRFWSGTKMFYETGMVLDCLAQQITFDQNSGVLPYDHIGLHKAAFMFYTGLNVKDSKEMWQGDVIQFTKHNGYLLDSFTAEVVWLKDDAAFGYRHNGCDYPFNTADELQEDILNHTVILGNAYENPDLLATSISPILPCGKVGCQNPHERVYRGCDFCQYINQQ